MASNEHLPSATIADWGKDRKGIFTRSLLASLRSYKYWKSRGTLGWLPSKIALIHHYFWPVVTGCGLPITNKIGSGLLVPHPNGIFVHPSCTIGPNCLIFRQVTLRSNERSGANGVPAIGGNVEIGAGAKILGRVSVSDHSVIGANCLVLNDVIKGAASVGIMARIILLTNDCL